MVFDQFFEQLKNHYDHQLPFVVYKKPNALALKGIFQPNDVLHTVADFTESGFVFAAFDSRLDTYIIPIDQADVLTVYFDENDFSKSENLNQNGSHLVHSNKDSEKLSHIKLVENGIEAINSGSFSKVVLSRREKIDQAETHPFEIFKRLLRRYPSAFVYCWYHPKVGLWLGATPETLLSVHGYHLKTMSLAGTQAFEGKIDVVWGEKEKEEQLIVTDFIVESLRESVGTKLHSSQIIKISDQKTVRAGNLLHLQTEISMPLSPQTKNLKPILEALHPTPAVCGFPKDKAKDYIIENEGYPREFYAGFMGELNLKETIRRNPNRRNVENNAYNVDKLVSDLYVNLRCMQIKDEKIYIYVGGGITKDSDPLAEWEETVHKSKIIKSVL